MSTEGTEQTAETAADLARAEESRAGMTDDAANTAAISGSVKATRKAVLTIVASEFLADAIARIVPSRWRVSRAVLIGIAMALIALLPLLGGLVTMWAGDTPSGAAWGWIATYSLLTLLLFASARWTFQHLLELSKDVARMFIRRGDVEKLTAWLARQTHWTVRSGSILAIGVAIAIGVGGAVEVDHHVPAGLILVHGRRVPHPVQIPEAGLAWFIASGLTLFWAGDTVSWLVRIPLLVRRLQRVPRLRMIVHAPVTTPGIRELSRFLSVVDALAAAGLLLFAIPIFWSVLLALHHASTQVCLTHAMLKHHCPHPWNLVWISALPLALTLVLNIYVTFVSQWWLSQVVEKQRDRLADEFGANLVDGELQSQRIDINAYAQRRALYDTIAGAATRTIEGRAIFRKALLILGSVTPYLTVLATRVFHVAMLFLGLKPSGKT